MAANSPTQYSSPDRRVQLKPRQLEIALLMPDGLSSGDIAARLHLSPKTARSATHSESRAPRCWCDGSSVRVCWIRSHRAARHAGEEKPADPPEPPGGSGRCTEQSPLGQRKSLKAGCILSGIPPSSSSNSAWLISPHSGGRRCDVRTLLASSLLGHSHGSSHCRVI
jgi:hypothetical protein